MESARVESELPYEMARLDLVTIMEMDDPPAKASDQKNEETETRVLRKRKSLKPVAFKSSNRRVSMEPRKKILPENANPKQIEAIYLNKKVKSTSQTLETIFEEPKTNDTLIGGRKTKRLLTFQLGSQYTKERIRKRRAKIKKLLGNKSFLNRKKIPMDVFLNTIECLDLDEPIQTEVVQQDTASKASKCQ